MRTGFFSLLLASLAILGGCSHWQAKPQHEEVNYFGSMKVHRYELANGLKILIVEDHSAPTFAYQTWFKVGSRDEVRGLTGLAHLFEHMMFKGTKNNKEGTFDRMLEMAGAEGENAFTSRDYTGYVQNLPSDKLDLIAGLEADRMVNLIVNDESLSKEREVVQNERRLRKENNPDGQLYQRLYEVAYKTHPYQWPVIGYEKDLNDASRDSCENFYKRFYAPNNATVVIVGDVDHERALATVKKYYGALKPSKMDRPVRPEEGPQAAERSETLAIKTPVEKLMLGYHGTDVNAADFPALEVLRNILAGGKGARLYKRLIDAGYATGVEIENPDMTDPGIFLLSVNMQKGKTAKQALPLIEKELNDIASGNMSTEELSRAVSMHRFSIFDGMVSNHAKAQFLGYYETVAGSFERGVGIVNALNQVDASQVAGVTKKYFQKSTRTTIIGTPLQKENK